jgi:predicted nucleotide-binding protein
MRDAQEGTQIPKEIVKGKKGKRPGQLYFPRNSLEEAIRIPKIIWEENAGNPMAILDLAKKLTYAPTTSLFAELLRSSNRYGLTEGSWQQDFTKTISLTELGKSVVAPTPTDNIEALKRKALETPKVFQKLLQNLNGKIIPSRELLINALIRDSGLHKTDAEACYEVTMKNIQELRIYDDIQSKRYLRLDKLGSLTILESESEGEIQQKEILTESVGAPTPTPVSQVPKQIFVAHGKNKKPLEQLTHILKRYGIPHIVANDEPHKARPVGVKVAEEMKKCSSGIFICTGDIQTTNEKGETILQPNYNVVYELGAGSVLYGNKIVLLREDGVNFASDFTEIGHITFEKDKLDAKGEALLWELAGLEIIKFNVTQNHRFIKVLYYPTLFYIFLPATDLTEPQD